MDERLDEVIAEIDAALAAWDVPRPRVLPSVPPVGRMPHPGRDTGTWIDLADALIEHLESGDEVQIEAALGCLRKDGVLIEEGCHDAGVAESWATWDAWWLTRTNRFGWSDDVRDRVGFTEREWRFPPGRQRTLFVGSGLSLLGVGLAWVGRQVTVLECSRLAVAMLRARLAREPMHERLFRTLVRFHSSEDLVEGMRRYQRGDFERPPDELTALAAKAHVPGGSLSLVAGDLMHACDAPGPFDLVHCKFVLNNWPVRGCWREALDMLVRRLGPDGRLEIHHVGTCKDPSGDDLSDWLTERGLSDESYEWDTGTPGQTFSVVQSSTA